VQRKADAQVSAERVFNPLPRRLVPANRAFYNESGRNGAKALCFVCAASWTE
jgi:hypothetical protein